MVILFILAIVAVVAWFAFQYVAIRYEDFLREHSSSLHALNELNEQFTFYDVPNFDMEHPYDNENFYNDIRPKDYLTYQLVYKKKDVLAAINQVRQNAENYASYQNKVALCRSFGVYGTVEAPKWEWLLLNREKKLFSKAVQLPRVKFSIVVTLVLTDISERYITSKKEVFGAEEIEGIIHRLSQKSGDFYLNEDVWQSICRVERGRVTNKLRFAIYARDGNRCCKCGRATQDLEIDHIYPISKGGKSTYDNLQTLCHDCNVRKSNTVERGAVNPRQARQEQKYFCPKCGAMLVLKNGKNNQFYACPNFPRCRHTQSKI